VEFDMKRLIKLSTSFIAIAVVPIATLIRVPLAMSTPELSIKYLEEGDPEGTYRGIKVNIPVNETTSSAYGGQLRWYDVAIAQAVAIAYKQCPSRQDPWGVQLQLTAGNQKQYNMGSFTFSCNLAYDLVSAYGLNNEIKRPVYEGYTGRLFDYYPSLNLDTENKVQRFINFASNFKPIAQSTN
jgi:serine/threonine-protein kinase